MPESFGYGEPMNDTPEYIIVRNNTLAVYLSRADRHGVREWTGDVTAATVHASRELAAELAAEHGGYIATTEGSFL